MPHMGCPCSGVAGLLQLQISIHNTPEYAQGRAVTYLLNKDMQVNLGSKFREI